MRNPAEVLELVETCTGKLDTLSKMLAKAHDDATGAEEAWDELFDAVAESMTEEYREAGRKSDPAEHTIASVARRQNRAVYQAYRRTRREVDKLEKVASNRRAELNGYQSELSTARAELQGSSGPQPQWSHPGHGEPMHGGPKAGVGGGGVSLTHQQITDRRRD